MWSERKIYIDGYNSQERICYEVVEEIEHHFYVCWRKPNATAFADYVNSLNDFKCKHNLPLIRNINELTPGQTSLAEVIMFSGEHGKKEFDSILGANKYWSDCMARQLSLF